MNKAQKTMITVMLAATIMLAGSACAPAPNTDATSNKLSGKIVISGSTSMEELMTAFEELLKIKDQCVGTQEVNETGIVKSTVAGNRNAVGYMSLGKVDSSIKALSVDNVAPSSATVLEKTYQLQRPYLCLTKGSESDLVKAFFEFIGSAEGQNLVVKKGYIKIN